MSYLMKKFISRPFISSVNCYDILEYGVREYGSWWNMYLVLIVGAVTIISGLCDIIFYALYGHPWEAIPYELEVFHE